MTNNIAKSLKPISCCVKILFFCGIAIYNIQAALIYVLFLICVPSFFNKNFDIFEPEAFFFCWYFYYFGLGYFCYRLRDSIGMMPFKPYNNVVVYKGILFSIVAAVLLKAALKVIKKEQVRFIDINTYLNKNILSTMMLITVFNTMLNTFFWYKLRGIPLFIPKYHDSTKATLGLGLGYIEYLNNFIFLLILLHVIIYFHKARNNNKIIALLIIYNLLVIPLLNDSRSTVVFSLMNVVMFYSWIKRKIKIYYVFLLGFFMALLASIWGIIRSAGSLVAVGLVFLNEIAVEYDGYLNTIQLFPTQVDFQYGKTLISCFALLLPRIILPNKNDFPTGGIFLKEINHMYHIRVGIRFTFLGEMYLNFGFVGIIFSVFFFLFLLSILRKCYYTASTTKNYILYLAAYFILTTMRSYLAGDAGTAFTFSFYNALFLLMVIGVFSTMKSERDLWLKKKRTIE